VAPSALADKWARARKQNSTHSSVVFVLWMGTETVCLAKSFADKVGRRIGPWTRAPHLSLGGSCPRQAVCRVSHGCAHAVGVELEPDGGGAAQQNNVDTGGTGRLGF